MKSRGLIFSAPMVRAMLEGRKFCTRRLDKSWLKYKKGSELWVREPFAINGHGQVAYKADGTVLNGLKWKSPIFMFRKDSRISHILTEDAREERLQDITKEEAKMEGCTNGSPLYALSLYDFRDLWNTLHPKKDRWEDNPVVARLCWL